MTKYRFSEGAALVFGGSGGLGTGIVNLLAESGSDVAFTYYKNKESAESNLKNIEVTTSNCLNIKQLLSTNHIILSNDSLDSINAIYGKQYA